MTWGKAFQIGLRYWVVFAISSAIISRVIEGWDLNSILFVVVALAGLPVVLLVVIVPSLSLNSISRRRELMADRFTLLYLGDSRTLISTIRKVAVWDLSFFQPQVQGRARKMLSLGWLPSIIRRHTVSSHPTITERIRSIRRESSAQISLDSFLPSLSASIFAGLVAGVATIGMLLSLSNLSFFAGSSSTQEGLFFGLLAVFVVPVSIIAYTNTSNLSLRSNLVLNRRPSISAIFRFLAKLGGRNFLSSLAAVSLFATIGAILSGLINIRTNSVVVDYVYVLIILIVFLVAYFFFSGLGSLFVFGRFYLRQREKFMIRKPSAVRLSYGVPFEKQLRINKLDSLFLVLSFSSGIAFLFVRILTTPIPSLLFGVFALAPIVLLAWVFPLYYGYVVGGIIRNSAIDRLRGWIFLFAGLTSYGGFLFLRWQQDALNSPDIYGASLLIGLLLVMAVIFFVGSRLGKQLKRFIFYTLDQESTVRTRDAAVLTSMASVLTAAAFDELDLQSFALLLGMAMVCLYLSSYYANKVWKVNRRQAVEGPAPVASSRRPEYIE